MSTDTIFIMLIEGYMDNHISLIQDMHMFYASNSTQEAKHQQKKGKSICEIITKVKIIVIP